MRDCFIGCSGYYYREWKDLFYPKGLPQKNWLEYYSSRFNTLEINNTFYRYPTPKLFSDWYDRSPSGFVFSVKVPRIITQYRKFNDTKILLHDFYCMAADGLKDKLGCILFQLPPSYHYSETNLQKLIESLEPGFKNIVEFRHAGWWQEHVYQTLKKHNIGFCCISHPTLPDVAIQTSETIYVRFHGVPELYKSAYSLQYLQRWADEIKKLKNIESLFVYFNNTMTAEAIANAEQLKEMLKC